jgi:hypothetical protein
MNYTLIEGDGSLKITARSLAHAKRRARRWVADSYDPDFGETIWADVRIMHRGECVEDVEVQIDPDAPKCNPVRARHTWQQIHLSGHGGGVLIIDRCARCGYERTTDTYAQRPDNGVQGYRTVEYRHAGTSI